MKVVSLSENTVVVLFDQTISKQIAGEVLKLRHLIDKELSEFVIDIIPSYTSIHLSFNLRKISHQDFVERVEPLTQQVSKTKLVNSEQKLIEIPIYYGEEVGLDLEDLTNSELKKLGITDHLYNNVGWPIFSM